MGDHIKIEFENLEQDKNDVIIALLSEIDYEGFEEEPGILKAYISQILFDPEKLLLIAKEQGVDYSIEVVPGAHWNKEWETNFQPVIINHPRTGSPWVAIRAEFHEPIRFVEHELLITPKMSFGTGHHPTTSMMMTMMAGLEFSGKTVLDFGTGTGVLGILSEKLGAKITLAIDNDDQSIINSIENFKSNDCTRIRLEKASSPVGEEHFDIILANIVRIVILSNLSAFVERLKSGGKILLSGLLPGDETEIMAEAAKLKLVLERRVQLDNWLCLQMTYQPTTN